jgi:hypothetical protein
MLTRALLYAIVDTHQSFWGETVAKSIIGHLAKRHMAGSFAPSAEQARREILAMIPEGASVYRGGSMSTPGLGLWEQVARLPGVRLIDPYEPGLSKEQSYERRRQGLLADILIASTNAITLDGRLVNLDGTGNRVAAMIFGPAKVILAVGMNKVVTDLDAARERIRRYVAPVNARRVGVKTPCVLTGLCSDCDSPQRICNAWSIIEGQIVPDRIHVKLIGEELGY